MKLTLCLVTKGREKYLDDILASIELALSDNSVDVLLIDNGCESSVHSRLKAWTDKFSQAVNYIRLDVNTPDASEIWTIIKQTNVDWIVMPGDDDQFRSEIISEWRAAIRRNPNLVAYAASAAVIDDNGKLTGEVLTPSSLSADSPEERIAMALHEPPFVWPILFFRVSKLNTVVPNSRYVFDWWVGVSLLLAGEVESTQSIGLNYRAHLGQESNIAPNRRKYFEASLWLHELVRGSEFKRWLTELSDEGRILFWNIMRSKQPVYGDAQFGDPLVFSLSSLLMETAKASSVRESVISDLALMNGVFLKEGEVRYFMRNGSMIDSPNPGNVRVVVKDGACETVLEASQLVRGNTLSPVFGIACHHSSTKSDSVSVDCDRMIANSPGFNADLIIHSITEYAESRGDFQTKLTAGERMGLLLFRKFKSRLPSRARNLLKRLRH